MQLTASWLALAVWRACRCLRRRTTVQLPARSPTCPPRCDRREGEEADNFYVIESGRFEATKGDAPVFTYEGQGSFGELALMYNCPRAATVTGERGGGVCVVFGGGERWPLVCNCGPRASQPPVARSLSALLRLLQR